MREEFMLPKDEEEYFDNEAYMEELDRIRQRDKQFLSNHGQQVSAKKWTTGTVDINKFNPKTKIEKAQQVLDNTISMIDEKSQKYQVSSKDPYDDEVTKKHHQKIEAMRRMENQQANKLFEQPVKVEADPEKWKGTGLEFEDDEAQEYKNPMAKRKVRTSGFGHVSQTSSLQSHLNIEASTP